MKRIFTVLVGLLLFFQVAEAHKKKRNQPSCDSDSFSSEVLKEEKVSESCIRYEIKVSYDGTKTYGLSHYSIGIPCGEIKDASNSKGWPMVFGKDKTTGVYGLKVDNINGFGERGKDSFIVKFTWCSSSSCTKALGVVAYKAGQCVDYDTLSKPVTNPPPTENCSILRATLEKTNVTCSDQTNGELKVVVQEGTAPYTYTWSNGAKTDLIQNVSAGIYSVTVKDAKGNVMTLRAEVTAPAPIIINEEVFNPACSGQTNGSISLSVSGGTGNYTYWWTSGATTADLNNLASGYYRVTVTDSIGCSATKAIMLTDGTLISAETSLMNPTCSQSNGSIDLTPVGGVGPYTFEWNTGETTEDLNNLPEGTYRVRIADASGCYANKTYRLYTTNPLSVQYTVKPTSCAGDNSGEIDVKVNGATGSYQFQWADGATTEDRSGLTSGTYDITVTDANGCTTSVSIYVGKKTLQVNSEILQPTCAQGTGTIIITPVDGSGPYTYEWSNGGTGSTITDLPGGSYDVTITDAAGCSEQQSFYIMSPPVIEMTGDISSTQCGAPGSLAIDLSVWGGNYPYTYNWSNGETTEDLSGLSAGTYTVEVKDAGGCTVSKSFTINATEVSWSCLINPATVAVVCGSAGNALNTSIADATSYEWTVTSSDNNWAITSGSTAAEVIYTAGSPGSTATFTLTIVKNGCTQTCSYNVTGGCAQRDNTGGGDPSSSEPCTTTPTVPPVVVEPTPEPEPEEPTQPGHGGCKSGVAISAYPNPFHDRVTLEWTASANERVRLEIFDMRGNRVAVLFDGHVTKGQRCSYEWTANGCKDPFYQYRLTSSKNVSNGKLVVKR